MALIGGLRYVPPEQDSVSQGRRLLDGYAGGRKVRLAKGRKNRQQAEQKFHELMLVRHQAPDAAPALVADLVEAFLAAAHKRCAADTYRNYRFYAQKFAETCGQRIVTELTPYHVTQRVDRQRWNATTERNARRVALQVMSWAKEEGLVHANPLQGMKFPPPNARKRALSTQEIKTILGRAHGPFRILLWTLLQTGAGPTEVRRLTWEEVRQLWRCAFDAAAPDHDLSTGLSFASWPDRSPTPGGTAPDEVCDHVASMRYKCRIRVVGAWR